MYNHDLTKFVLRFLTNLLLVFSLHIFIVRLHLQKFFFVLMCVCTFLFFYFIIHLIMTGARSKRRVLLLVFIVTCFKRSLLI